ncbi:muts domain V-domain-containing protein [Chaetomidium leptoderma]|uniref:Muts domain V-domain-containing protein n=1 Tax=Chaetomidium leptoderma TaxID=669021 RepID=A0AAN6VKB0_9PEZI|nr:muts domain V-domain-containing protein [Chaetomidium leptoderma]
MLSPRPAPVPRLRIACLGPSARSFPRCSPATVGRFGQRNVTTARVSLASGGHRGHRGPGPLATRSPLRQTQLLPQVRGKKTRTVVKLDELPQGIVIPSEPLPLEEDEPTYPTVVLQARRNMQKFDNCVLLTRVGGFYELYFDQADEYGPLLNLKVAQKKTSAGPVPMAGFPFFQLDRFLKILVQDLNRHVAIAEEFPNDPSEKIKSGGLMHNRKVARIVTPGTLIDENFMDPYANNYVLAIHLPEPAALDHVSCQEGQRAAETSESFANDTPARIGLAWLDLSTGYFFTQPTTLASLGSVLSRVSPREIVLDKALESDQNHSLLSILQEERYLVSYSPQGELRQLSDWAPMLESEIPAQTVEKFTESEVQAGSLLLHYVEGRLQGLSMKLQPPLRHENMDIMSIDKNSMRSMEIKQTVRDGAFKGSLLHAIRRTVTKSGARLLDEWLSAPSTSLEVINFRQDLVSRFIQDEDLRDAIVVLLRRSHDSQRLVQKFALNRGDPDDLLRLANTIKATEDIVILLNTSASPRPDNGSENHCLSTMVARISLDQPLKLAERIRDAIDEEGLVQQHQIEDSEAGEMMALAQEIVKAEGTEEDSTLLPKGAAAKTTKQQQQPKKSPSIRDHYGEDGEVWIMRPAASALLSRLHGQLATLRQEKDQLTETLRARLGATSLTLRWTPGLGHICHVKGKDARRPPAAAAAAASEAAAAAAAAENETSPPPTTTIRTLSSSRTTRSFHQPEWTALGESLDKLRFQIRAEEQRVFAALRARVVHNLVKLRRNALVLDELDIATSFALLAIEQRLVRPLLTNTQQTIIVGGRHPTVEGGLAEQGRTFQRNDCLVGGGGGTAQGGGQKGHGRIWLITGPNMAGKSTFLRQNALITILAQIGCYVPADYASLGIVDAIFSRVGSADNLYQDQSTFMVEMLETAAILRQATPRSFVIMDEVGRGTTPEDGTAVAFAALHHLVSVNKCRALFATHFHGIADLVAKQGMRVEDGGPNGAIDMYCTDVEEDDQGGFVYVYKLRKGINTQSHALKVARLAGLPEQAIRVAQQVLQDSGAIISSQKVAELAGASASAAVVG